ncbi:hypothetical protein AFUB_042300 [Aspergillus fumigatus A1163]|uniref:Xylanolytic transcriptional activator regulatory domain-containing protein n=1 Tax=Aspergillus fumigatus (strain CBS 144.89 / FGSC A1163 / CEA10) TaxID=451804 RepID=B0XYW3_ASPFC|nr:hypothetical protein AFUB_042300 [Aspergillus fumigatus A1163]
MDAFFLNYHTSYPFVHEATFKAQFYEQVPRPHGQAWQILLNTILALGAWSIGDDNSDLDITFYQEARSHLQQVSVFETGNLTLILALLLLSNYAQKRNKPNTGWNFLGLAVRMAMSLGLHKEFPGWKISLLQREMRRRLWWGCVYIRQWCGENLWAAYPLTRGQCHGCETRSQHSRRGSHINDHRATH